MVLEQLDLLFCHEVLIAEEHYTALYDEKSKLV